MTELRDKLQHGSDLDGSDQADEPGGAPDLTGEAGLGASDGAKGGGGGSGAGAGRPEPMHSVGQNFQANGFSVWESHLALRLGVNRRDVIIPARQKFLQEGLHFIRTGRRVVYCALGVEKLTAMLTNGSVVKKSLPAAVLCEPRPVLGRFKFTVRRKAINSHVLECVDHDQKIVVVRVRNSANFMPGMEVTAIPYGTVSGVFEFAGVYPRFRGKY